MKTLLDDAQATRDLGKQIAALAYPGLVLALQGELGAGKTTLAQGVGQGLGVEDRVCSPTFIIMALYEGRLPLAHADLYRLGDESELGELGLEEHLSEGVTLIEWSERFPDLLPKDHLRVCLRDHGEGRSAELLGTGPRSQALVLAIEGAR